MNSALRIASQLDRSSLSAMAFFIAVACTLPSSAASDGGSGSLAAPLRGTPVTNVKQQQTETTVPQVDANLNEVVGIGRKEPAVPQMGWHLALVEGRRRLKTDELTVAEICFREAVQAVKKDKSASADDIVTCQNALAAVLQREDQTQDVIPLYRKSLKVLRRAHGPDSIESIDTLLALADVYSNDSFYRRASQYYQSALAILDKNSQARTMRYAEIEHRLGLSLFKGGSAALAEKKYDDSLSLMISQSQLPDDHSLHDLLIDYIDLLRKVAPNGRVAKSAFQRELLKDQLEHSTQTGTAGQSYWSKQVSTNIFNPDALSKSSQQKAAETPAPNQTFTPANAQSTTANGLVPPPMELDKSMSDSVALDQINKQRIQFYERMIAIDINTLGPQHPSVARDLTGLAYLYLSQNRNDEAKVLLQRALKIYEKSYANDMLVKRTQAMLTLIERGQQADKNEAFNSRNYAATLPQIPAAAQNIEIALRLNYLALLCYSEGRTESAERIYPWALAATSSACGEQSAMAGACLSDYALVLRNAGKTSEAEELDRTATVIVSKSLARQAALSMP